MVLLYGRAATSSSSDTKAHAPLAMHLLACMLARAFKAEEAISTWVELVQARRQEIETKIDSEPQTLSACMAARHDITREQLALWDTSARSWLRSADEAKKLQRTQLQLVVNNLHLEFAHRDSTYETITDVWRYAMMGLEKCIKGTPQEVSDGSILLALSSWHLYPDLIVPHEKTTKVAFDDPLLQSSGAMTIGLEFAPGSRPAGVHWSLTLSHLRYYGNAVKVESYREVQRITMEQLMVMLFGDLLSSWKIPKDTEQQSFCAQWLIKLGSVMQSTYGAELTSGAGRYAWILTLVSASHAYLDLNRSDARTCSMLLGWGRRRCRKFLGSTLQAPFFGLESPLLGPALGESDPLEAGVHFLRIMAKNMGLSASEAVIRCNSKVGRSQRLELMTAIPHTKSHPKRLLDGTCRPQEVHFRWVGVALDTKQDLVSHTCVCDECGEHCPYARGNGTCAITCHEGNQSRNCTTVGPWPLFRHSVATNLGEQYSYLYPQQIRDHESDISHSESNSKLSMSDFEEGGFAWRHPPHLFHNHDMPTSSPEPCPSLNNGATKCSCSSFCVRPSKYYHDAYFRPVHGSMTNLGLFVRIRVGAYDAQSKYESNCSNARQVLSRRMDSDGILDILHRAEKQKGHLFLDFIKALSAAERYSIIPDSKDYSFDRVARIIGVLTLPPVYIKSLSLLSVAYDLYSELSGATIPMDILHSPLHECKWFSDNQGDTTLFGHIEGLTSVPTSHLLLPKSSLGRKERFACIAFFESGLHNVEASYCGPVIALASANSIFVAEDLLTDPATTKEGRIRRVVGNIGRAGISMLILPQQPPEIRPLGNDWRAVPHNAYNHCREDNLSGTTLVLSFTEWKRPLPMTQRGTVDEDVNFIECVVSVHDRGRWVADIDPIDLKPRIWTSDCVCDSTGSSTAEDVSSIDSWEELLDAPDNVAIVRAQGNWVARLAAAAIQRQRRLEGATCVIPLEIDLCVKCFEGAFKYYHSRVNEMGNGGVIID